MKNLDLLLAKRKIRIESFVEENNIKSVEEFEKFIRDNEFFATRITLVAAKLYLRRIENEESPKTGPEGADMVFLSPPPPSSSVETKLEESEKVDEPISAPPVPKTEEKTSTGPETKEKVTITTKKKTKKTED